MKVTVQLAIDQLSGPLRPDEREALDKATDYAMSDTWMRLFPLIDRVLLERKIALETK